jgi:hypothetical protein
LKLKSLKPPSKRSFEGSLREKSTQKHPKKPRFWGLKKSEKNEKKKKAIAF